jgi:hypothetical protein
MLTVRIALIAVAIAVASCSPAPGTDGSPRAVFATSPNGVSITGASPTGTILNFSNLLYNSTYAPVRLRSTWDVVLSLIVSRPGRYGIFTMRVNYMTAGRLGWQKLYLDVRFQAIPPKTEPRLVQPFHCGAKPPAVVALDGADPGQDAPRQARTGLRGVEVEGQVIAGNVGQRQHARPASRLTAWASRRRHGDEQQ